MSKTFEVGDNIGCLGVVALIVGAIVALSLLDKFDVDFADPSVQCVKAGGTWRPSSGCRAAYCERAGK